MFRRGTAVLLSGLFLALTAAAQPGPGLFGDRRFRAPVANAAALPVSATLGEVRLTLDDGALHFWDGNSWEDVAGSGGGGEANTASNLGGGLGLFSAKVGVDLRFNSLAAADFDLASNLVTIDDTKWAKDSELPTGDAPHSRVVTVDASGLGDYTTIKAACDYVATQAGRSASSQWLILVYPGPANPALEYDDWYNYAETPLTVPSWTSLQGVASAHNTPIFSASSSPVVQFTATSGTMVTLGEGATVSNLQVVYIAEPAGAVDVFTVGADGTMAVLDNVAVFAGPLGDAFPVVVYSNRFTSSALYLYDTSSEIVGVPHADSTNVLNASSVGTSLYGGRFIGSAPCSSLLKNTAGTLKLFWVRLDTGGCTYDLDNAGGTIRVISAPYSTAFGAITHDDGSQGTQFCKTFSGTGTPEGSVSAPVCSSYWRRDGGAFTALYLKQSGSGNTGWAAVGASVAADAVALGTDTTGAYVAGATASQGLALTGSEAGTLGLMDCAANEIPKRNAGDTAWECAADSAGSGVGGATGSTDNAILRADGTGGATVQASLATIDDAGALTLSNGSVTAPSFKFSAGGLGLYSTGSGNITITNGSLGWWTINQQEIRNFNGGRFANVGSGEPVFVPNPAGNGSGLGSSGSNIVTVYASNTAAMEWRRIAAGLVRTVDMAQAADTPQAATCEDSGDGSPGALTVNPTTALVQVTGLDVDGCTLTLGETNVANGVRVRFVVTAIAGGAINFSDTPGVTELAGAFPAGLYDVIDLLYISDRWVEVGRSDN